MRRSTLIGLVGVVCVLMLRPAGAASQPSTRPSPLLEVAAGYSHLGGGRILDGQGLGVFGGGGWTPVDWLAIIVEAGSNRIRQDVGLLDAVVDYRLLATGARISTPSGHVRPFAQALVGRSRLDYAVSSPLVLLEAGRFDETHSAWQIGGGLEVPMTPATTRRVGLRIGIDYRRVQTSEPLGQTRVHTTIWYRFLQR